MPKPTSTAGTLLAGCWPPLQGTQGKPKRCCVRGRGTPTGIDMSSTFPTPKKSPVVRAVELARSGRCRTTADVFATLKQEGYEAHSVGPWMTRLLRDMIDGSAAGLGNIPRAAEKKGPREAAPSIYPAGQRQRMR